MREEKTKSERGERTPTSVMSKGELLSSRTRWRYSKGLAVETGNHFQNFQIFRNDADPFRTSLLMMNESVTRVFIY